MHALLFVMFLGSSVPAQPRLAHLPPSGKLLFDQNCRKCHGVKGTPSPSMKRMMPKIPTLDAATVSQLTLQSVVQNIAKGKGDMKPFADKLSAEEIDAVAQYVFELASTTPKAGK